MIYSREIEFSFWVRLVPVRSSQTEVHPHSDTLGQESSPEHPSQLTLSTYFLHIIATTFGKGKGFYSFSFRVPVVTERLKISIRMMT